MSPSPFWYSGMLGCRRDECLEHSIERRYGRPSPAEITRDLNTCPDFSSYGQPILVIRNSLGEPGDQCLVQFDCLAVGLDRGATIAGFQESAAPRFRSWSPESLVVGDVGLRRTIASPSSTLAGASMAPRAVTRRHELAPRLVFVMPTGPERCCRGSQRPGLVQLAVRRIRRSRRDGHRSPREPWPRFVVASAQQVLVFGDFRPGCRQMLEDSIACRSPDRTADVAVS